jgi:cytochrome c peroxidase
MTSSIKAGLAIAVLIACLSSTLPIAAGQTAGDYFSTRLPGWVPVPRVPPDNPMSEAKVALGRRLFYDTRLSGNRMYACASCHAQARAFTDGYPWAIGSTGLHHPRSAMSLTNVAYNASFGWKDQRLGTLEAQMEVPMYNENPIELGLKGREEEVLARFTNAADIERFHAAFPGEPDPVSIRNIIKAVASFERVLISANSAFDRYRYQNDRRALSPEALRGSTLFFSDRVGCSRCHASFNLSGPITVEGEEAPQLQFHNTGVTLSTDQFRAPTLRNIAVTAPYMHNGSIATLRDVIEHYAGGGRGGPFVSARLTGFRISPSEIDDLLAFLQSLTDEEFLTNPAFSDPRGQTP